MKELYKIVALKFEDNSNLGVIDKKKCIAILGYMLHVPKKVRKEFLKNMEKINIIKKIDNKKYKINLTSNTKKIK